MLICWGGISFMRFLTLLTKKWFKPSAISFLFVTTLQSMISFSIGLPLTVPVMFFTVFHIFFPSPSIGPICFVAQIFLSFLWFLKVMFLHLLLCVFQDHFTSPILTHYMFEDNMSTELLQLKTKYLYN